MRNYTAQEIIDALESSSYAGEFREVSFRTKLGLPLSPSEKQVYEKPDFWWILTESVEVELIAQNPEWGPLYEVRRANGEVANLYYEATGDREHAITGWVLVNGQDFEFDESIWGFMDEVSDELGIEVGKSYTSKPDGPDPEPWPSDELDIVGESE